MARHFFAPLLISGVEDIERGTVDVYVTSDLGDDQPGQVIWKLTDLDGVTLSEGVTEVTVMGRQSQLMQTLQFSQQISAVGKRNLLLWLSLCVAGEQASSNLVTFARPKQLELRDPGFAASVRREGQDFKLTVTVERPALYTWLSLSHLNASFSKQLCPFAAGTASRNHDLRASRKHQPCHRPRAVAGMFADRHVSRRLDLHGKWTGHFVSAVQAIRHDARANP